ncbi:CehA/McbA family metallohydrolase [Hymenobacter perfusus]|uniref:T9SS C-terminal target domain-containing protein n=1 Tax=Hymenobacter perfusus TaxID=1236770 RepID=A0A428KI32_9BACT|nr:CehA/McbA family metallohydrolase [Hymenobacter perfusus]RSK46102.1 T9SS C-terminal target domain-containing protein [Hymenobacter perfusus]
MAFSTLSRLGPLVLGGLLTSTVALAQTPTLLDDFNRADNPSVGNGWAETETAAPGSVSVASNQLRLSSRFLGRDFAVRDMSGRYNVALQTNPGSLSWSWNMQQSRPNPSGFLNNNYAVGFVVAGSSADLLTGSGYAVVYGNSGASDSLRLVRYTNGLSATTVLKTLAAVAVPALPTTGPYFTVRVTYSPEESTWTLEQAANNMTFEDPATASFVRVGSRSDSVYTRTSLPYLGGLWNHVTTETEYAVFDNIYASSPCVTGPEPTQGPTALPVTGLTSSSVTLAWQPGNGTSNLVVVRQPGASTSAPVDGTLYPDGGVFGTGASLGTGAFSVFSGVGTSMGVQGLRPNTTYSVQIYEALGSGCTTNYLQSNPASFTFTTPACQLEPAPTVAATGATATLSGTNGAVLTWQPGNGSGRLVVLRAGQAPTGVPANGTTYPATTSFGGGAILAAGEYVVYAGTGNSVTVSGLPSGQTVYAAVYEYNGTGCATAYQLAVPATAQLVVPTPPPGTRNFYFGNLHGHSAYSDGNQDAGTSGASTPLQDFTFADASLHSDFLGISDHNHSQAGMSLPNYARGLQQADQATNSQFVALYGMEWGVISGGGHVLVYGVNELLGWETGNYDVYVPRSDYQALFRQINKRPGAFATLAHPSSGDYNNLTTAAFNARADSAVVGTVLRSGPATSTNTTYSNPSTSSYESTYTTLLAKGYHVGISYDHDNHNTTFNRTTDGRLVVVAPSLTKADLLAALRQRSFYASDDWNAEVTFSLNGQPMGSIFTGGTAPALTLSVNDLDGEAIRSITLLKGTPGSGQAAQAVATVTGPTALSYSDAALTVGATAYYYAVIVQQDGDRIVTSPIWYTLTTATPTKAAQPELALELFPNPASTSAILSYYLPVASTVEADVLDLAGRTVAVLRSAQWQSAGPHTLSVPTHSLPAGVYVVRLRQAGTLSVQRLLVQP